MWVPIFFRAILFLWETTIAATIFLMLLKQKKIRSIPSLQTTVNSLIGLSHSFDRIVIELRHSVVHHHHRRRRPDRHRRPHRQSRRFRLRRCFVRRLLRDYTGHNSRHFSICRVLDVQWVELTPPRISFVIYSAGRQKSPTRRRVICHRQNNKPWQW